MNERQGATNVIATEALLLRVWMLTVRLARQLGFHYMLRGQAAREYRELQALMEKWENKG